MRRLGSSPSPTRFSRPSSFGRTRRTFRCHPSLSPDSGVLSRHQQSFCRTWIPGGWFESGLPQAHGRSRSRPTWSTSVARDQWRASTSGRGSYPLRLPRGRRRAVRHPWSPTTQREYDVVMIGNRIPGRFPGSAMPGVWRRARLVELLSVGSVLSPYTVTAGKAIPAGRARSCLKTRARPTAPLG